MPTTVSSAYRRVATFHGEHEDGINCLVFSPSGQFFASGGGGDRQLLIWDALARTKKYRIVRKAPVVSVCWDPLYERALFVGLENGQVERIDNFRDTTKIASAARRGPAYVVAFNADRRLLAAAIGSEVYLYRESKEAEGDPVKYTILTTFSPPPRPGSKSVRARGIYFTHGGGRISVSFLYHGIYCWDTDSRAQQWHIEPHAIGRSGMIGSSALSPDDQEKFLTMNLESGLGIHKPDMYLRVLKSFPHVPSTGSNVPVSVAFLHGGTHVISGSNNGFARIWEMTGEEWQTLYHPGEVVRAIGAHMYEDCSLIATGTGILGTDSAIRLWIADIIPDDDDEVPSGSLAAMSSVKSLHTVWRGCKGPVLIAACSVCILCIALLSVLYCQELVTKLYTDAAERFGTLDELLRELIASKLREASAFGRAAHEAGRMGLLVLVQKLQNWLEDVPGSFPRLPPAAVY
ncbi:hypothetical protein PLICRDRAFT_176646 [Plicaturopsis crispa FD-325 SS-3]|nr:hypothetical protein PLICRDRAFT_176646 [Plicaturopsis crispa FD-325 SS-3]